MAQLQFFKSQIKMPLVSLPLRSTLVPLKNGKSVMISPVTMTLEQVEKLQKNPPTDLVAPNCIHHLYMKQAHEAFPQARLWASPGLQKKRADIPWNVTLSETNWPYNDELVLIMVEGIPKLNEAVFYHRESKTLIMTDLFYNLQKMDSFIERIFFGLVGTFNRPAVSRVISLFTKDKSRLKASFDRILQFDFDTIVMAHGEVLKHDAKKTLRDALAQRGLA